MNSFPCYSNNASIPLWLTIDEALEVVNRQTGVNIMVSEGGMPWGAGCHYNYTPA
ncbi:hypothetical protein STW0522KLE44_17270 [Klebsiella sp. STW0522-44]|nr:hypothetical protein STW0522KLE44_17270 [Klebsiella sp. STW0522-44]